ncbi:uncharacterized protein LOC133286320 [Gastrolobium bilobum]|uniref:uncharacterized protein LOC133286320 n=1 Tax=Gastrolobium bilobum TaxID=150636 RepID=UPI002AB148B0|nr:uncharacterized protein LOC133286320 [Gastrolobium bilobum]
MDIRDGELAPRHHDVDIPARIRLPPMEDPEIAKKNTANRAKLTIPHTLGSKSIARRKRELEIEKGKPISRAEMYAYGQKKKDGTFVNEKAREKNVFGKEHPGRVRCMGFGVCRYQVFKRGSSSGASSSASTDNEIRELKSKVQSLEEALAFVVRSFGGQMPPGFASNGLQQPQDLGSPNGFRPSSSASHIAFGDYFLMDSFCILVYITMSG